MTGKLVFMKYAGYACAKASVTSWLRLLPRAIACKAARR